MAATKVDFKRELRAFYSAGSEPVIVDVPEMAFLMIDGHGDPNTAPEYGEAIQALYPVAYAAKFAVRGGSGGLDFAVMPLEGLWWVPDMSLFTVEDKSAWDWTILIMQPDQVTQEIVEEAKTKAAKKNPPTRSHGCVSSGSRRDGRPRSCTPARTLRRGRPSRGSIPSSPSRVTSARASTTRCISATRGAPLPRR